MKLTPLLTLVTKVCIPGFERFTSSPKYQIVSVTIDTEQVPYKNVKKINKINNDIYINTMYILVYNIYTVYTL